MWKSNEKYEHRCGKIQGDDMTEEILISVKGMHALEGDAQDDTVEVFSAGKYYFKNGKHYIFYEEIPTDGSGLVKNRITLQDNWMEVQKKGAMNSTMTFETDKKHMSWYNTPFGNLMTGIEVTDMSMSEQENLIEVCVDYALEVNYERVADSRIQIRVMAKDSGLFSLR